MHGDAMNQSAVRTQRLLACLGDPSRFRVVATLLGGEHCVTDLADKVGLSQSCTTRHLQALLREGLVMRDRQGKRVMFRLCVDEPLSRALIEWALVSAPRFEWPAPVFAGGVPRLDSARESEPARTAGAPGRKTSKPHRDPTPSTLRAKQRAPDVPPEASGPGAGASDSSTTPAAPGRRGDLEDFLL